MTMHQELWAAYYAPIMAEAVRRAADSGWRNGPSGQWGLDWSPAIARERLDDGARRRIEAAARAAADAGGEFQPTREFSEDTLLGQYQNDLSRVLGLDVYQKRLARAQRKAQQVH